MNKTRARVIADTITNEQLQEMLDRAQSGIKDWHRVSDVNKSMTKGTAWNILAKGFDVTKTLIGNHKVNLIWEFGDYLPNEIKYPKRVYKQHEQKTPVHQEPIFE